MEATGRSALPITLFLCVLTLAVAGWGSLFNETDGQYAAAAKTMAEGGSWLIPENNGIPRLVKPPLLYWLMGASMKVFGVNEFAARLPGALSLIGCALAVFGIGNLWGGRRRGLLAAVILLTCLGSFTLCRIVMPEPLFTALIAGSLYSFLRACGGTDRRAWWVLAFWAFGALAAFAKGPHGILYPLLIALAALAARRLTNVSARWDIPPAALFLSAGPLVALAVNVPWYLFIESRFPGYLSNLLFAEHLGHVTGSDAPATNYSTVPRPVFTLLHVAWFFPWSIAVLTTAPVWLRRIPSPSRWSLVGWIVVVWAALVFSSVLLTGQRQDYYAMAMWPAFALLAARCLEGLDLRNAVVASCAVLLLALTGAFLAPGLLAGAGTAPVAERATALSTVSQFGGEVWGRLTFIAFCALGAAIVLVIFSRRSPWVFALAAACVGMGAVAGTARVAPFFSLAEVAPAITSSLGPQGKLIFDGDVDTASSLLFYADLPVHLVNADPDADFVIRTTGIGRRNYLDEDAAVRHWNSGAPVMLIIEAADATRWRHALGFAAPPLARCGTMVLLRNSAE